EASLESGAGGRCDEDQVRLKGVRRRDQAPQRAAPTLPHTPPVLEFSAHAHEGKCKTSPVWKNRLKPYDLLSKEEVNTIHEQAMTILEEIGVDFLHDGARELFQKAGMRVEENRVRFERAFVLEQ